LVNILRRISCEETMLAARCIWDQETADDIAANALQILTKTSGRKPFFFNGSKARCIVGGLFYILGFRFNNVVTQKVIAAKLETTETSVRQSFKKWIENFPELFFDVQCKLSKRDKDPHDVESPKNFDSILLASIDEAFTSLGQKVKTSLFLILENTFTIHRQEIPARIEDFDNALEQTFGAASRHLEIMIMKSLHDRTSVKCRWKSPQWLVPNLRFVVYVSTMREAFESKRKNQEVEVIIDGIKEIL
jgi:hypothetical protein